MSFKTKSTKQCGIALCCMFNICLNTIQNYSPLNNFPSIKIYSALLLCMLLPV